MCVRACVCMWEAKDFVKVAGGFGCAHGSFIFMREKNFFYLSILWCPVKGKFGKCML